MARSSPALIDVGYAIERYEPEDLTGRALRLRIRQQELLAELGVFALQRTSFTDMLDITPRG